MKRTKHAAFINVIRDIRFTDRGSLAISMVLLVPFLFYDCSLRVAYCLNLVATLPKKPGLSLGDFVI